MGDSLGNLLLQLFQALNNEQQGPDDVKRVFDRQAHHLELSPMKCTYLTSLASQPSNNSTVPTGMLYRLTRWLTPRLDNRTRLLDA